MASDKHKEKILNLRKDFWKAYKDSTGKKMPKNFKDTKSDNAYEPIREEMRFRLGILNADEKLMGGKTFRRFFFEKENFDFRNGTLQWFKKYIKAVKDNAPVPFVQNYIDGAEIIDSSFRRGIIRNNKHFTPTDFYLAKNSDGCQWYGVLKENSWYVDRQDQDAVKDVIIDSFENPGQNITAVIWGPPGSGKTTFLRKIAATVSEMRFSVIWVTDLGKVDMGIFNPLQNYCIIIEDWENIKSTKTKNSDFLKHTVYSKNIRVVIGDIPDAEDREYVEFVDRRKIFRISPADNEAIVKKALKVNKAWQIRAESVFSVKEFYNSPIYIILYVIDCAAKSKEDILKPNETYLGIFKKIIFNELEIIYQTYPGLARALFHWANLYQREGVIFHWEALLRLANYYDNGRSTLISQRLSTINNKTQIGETLQHYIYFGELTIPELEGNHSCHFHHGVIALEGISQPLKRDVEWEFDDHTVEEIFFALIQINDYYMAATIYTNFRQILNGQEKILKCNRTGIILSFESLRLLDGYYKGLRQLILMEKNKGEISDIKLMGWLISASYLVTACAEKTQEHLQFIFSIFYDNQIDLRPARDLFASDKIVRVEFESEFLSDIIRKYTELGWLNFKSVDK